MDTHTHTHIHFTAHWDYPGEPVLEPIWILLKQETVSGSGNSRAICKYAPRSRQTTMPAPHHPVFYRLDALHATQPTASKHRRTDNGKLFHIKGVEQLKPHLPNLDDVLGKKDRIPSRVKRETRNRWHNLSTTAKQVVMVWACVAKRRQWLGEEMYRIWSRRFQIKTKTKEDLERSCATAAAATATTITTVLCLSGFCLWIFVQKDCQAHKLNREGTMDCSIWQKIIKDGWWSG